MLPGTVTNGVNSELHNAPLTPWCKSVPSGSCFFSLFCCVFPKATCLCLGIGSHKLPVPALSAKFCAVSCLWLLLPLGLLTDSSVTARLGQFYGNSFTVTAFCLWAVCLRTLWLGSEFPSPLGREASEHEFSAAGVPCLADAPSAWGCLWGRTAKHQTPSRGIPHPLCQESGANWGPNKCS